MEKISEKEKQEKIERLNEYKEKVKKAIATDPDIIAYVQKVETGIKTTQNNYGKYMQFLTGILSQHGPAFTGAVALGLIESGANAQGVQSALKVIGINTY